MEDCLKQA